MKRLIAGLIIAGVCFSTAAQQPGPQSKQVTFSDDDFIRLHQQIKELKNPTFRAFLRTKLLAWESPEASSMRRHAALEVATEGVADLCEYQDEVWLPTASWLYGHLVKQIKTLQSPEETSREICVLKTGPTNNSEKDFSSGIKMLKNSETSVAGLNLAKSAILSGQLSAHAMLGQLSILQSTNSPHVLELLNTLLVLEEKQPGTLPLSLMPFFTSIFLDNSVPPETLKRFLFVAARCTRVSAEELGSPTVRGPLTTLLNGIIGPAKRLTPELYPEIASRLSSVSRTAFDMTEVRLAAEERIQTATDQLEQLISEANSASDEALKRHFFFRAARLAKERGQLSKAIDLITNAANASDAVWVNDFLSEIVALAIKKQSPRDATYALLKITRPLKKANAFQLLGDYYGAKQDNVKAKEAFTEAAKQLKSVSESNEKARSYLRLAESVLMYEPAGAYEVFRESVKAINNLPSPEKGQEKMYYVHLMPTAEYLIRSFRLLAIRENQTATNLAEEIKLAELRLAALSGASVP